MPFRFRLPTLRPVVGRPSIHSPFTRRSYGMMHGLGADPTGGTQVDTGGTQDTGATANPVMFVEGTNASVLPSAQPTILSTGVAPIATTPQSPLQVVGASALAVSSGGFPAPIIPAPAPSKSKLWIGLALIAGGAYLYSKRK